MVWVLAHFCFCDNYYLSLWHHKSLLDLLTSPWPDSSNLWSQWNWDSLDTKYTFHDSAFWKELTVKIWQEKTTIWKSAQAKALNNILQKIWLKWSLTEEHLFFFFMSFFQSRHWILITDLRSSSADISLFYPLCYNQIRIRRITNNSFIPGRIQCCHSS